MAFNGFRSLILEEEKYRQNAYKTEGRYIYLATLTILKNMYSNLCGKQMLSLLVYSH